MVEVGKIDKIKGSWATVRFDRKLACENCNMCFKPKEENYVELRVKNTVNAKVGDNVKVSMGDKAVITASAIVYAVPLVIVAIAVVISSLLSTEFVAFVSAIVALILSFVVVHIIDKKLKTNKAYFPQMVAIVLEDKQNLSEQITTESEIEEIENEQDYNSRQ
ncbi:MAG: SoxR reducing system RseC family protein [Bacillota bacterium]